MQTAVEWLVDELRKYDIGNVSLMEWKVLNELSEQANKMFEQQIIDAVEETIEQMNLYESFRTLKNGQQYYNETYGSNGSETNQ